MRRNEYMSINTNKISYTNKNVKRSGTHLIGYIQLSYKQLVKLFGPPYTFNGDKVDWCWEFKLNNSVITIYNWKNGPSYGFKIKPSSIDTWNVGGNYEYDLNILQDYIRNRKFKTGYITNIEGDISWN
jgi:hypothetical protein